MLMDFFRLVKKTGASPKYHGSKKDKDKEILSIDREFIGSAFANQFGENIKRGNPYPFSFHRFEDPLLWQVDHFYFIDDSLPLKNKEALVNILSQKPISSHQSKDLSFTWWGSPAKNVPEDKFITLAQAS